MRRFLVTTGLVFAIALLVVVGVFVYIQTIAGA